MHVLGGAGEAEPHRTVAGDRIEVDAGCRRDPQLVEPTGAQGLAVDAEMCDVGSHVERPVGRCEIGEAELGEPVEQQPTMQPVSGDVRLELLRAVERRERSSL